MFVPEGGYRGWASGPHGEAAAAVALGIFDGVHLGHQALLRCVVAQAAAHALVPSVLTFSPHPAQLLRPERAPDLIEPMAVRLRRLEAHGVAAAVVQPFDRALAATSAQDFVRDVLVKHLRVRCVVVGENFLFGHRQQGSVATLRAMGAELGFSVHAVPPVRVGDTVASSTQIRSAVRRGDVQAAAALLGRPYALWGDAQGPDEAAPGAVAWRPHSPLRPPPGHYEGRTMAGGAEVDIDLYVLASGAAGEPSRIVVAPRGARAWARTARAPSLEALVLHRRIDPQP